MKQKGVITAIAIIAAVILAGVISGLLYVRYASQPQPGSTAPAETEVLEALATAWPELEQSPLKHSAESGHWFLTQVQFASSNAMIVWYEDGLNDEFALLEYSEGNFQVQETFTDRSKLNEIRSRYGTSGGNAYSFNPDTQAFEQIDRDLFGGGPEAIPDPSGTPGTVSQVKIALLNPGGNLPNEVKPGDISGCDHVVLVEREIEPTTAPLTAALKTLLSWKEHLQGGEEIYNYAARGSLVVDSVSVADGIAKIYLTGTPPPLGGVCDDPRLFVQVAQTAKQFATVDRVELYVNGVRNDGTSDLRGE